MVENTRRPSPPGYRPSFTLVELLVAIAIIGVMAGMLLFSLAGAATDSKVARTRGTIAKINAVILQEWESYRYRAARLDIDSALLRSSRGSHGQAALSSREGAHLRMMVLRDLMRMEMPDRWTDILYPPTSYKAVINKPTGSGTTLAPYFAGNRYVPDPAVNTDGVSPGWRFIPNKLNIHRAQLNRANGATATQFVIPSSNLAVQAYGSVNTTVLSNQGAETLYMILATANYAGGSALEAFRPSEIGDTDEDGLLEILDAWGNPIRWLRWPCGFDSPLNQGSSPDAMDPLRTDWRWSATNNQKPWLLVPLIVSAGPDEVFDISFERVDSNGNPIPYATNIGHPGRDEPARRNYVPDPYDGSYNASGAFTGGGRGSYIDQDGDGSFSGATDNITNYSLILE